MKKLFILLLTIFSAIFCILPNSGAVVYAANDDFSVKSKAAYLVDYGSGEVIYAKNETERLPIASMTKLMLLNLCFDKLDEGEFAMTDDVTVSAKASGMGGSQVFLDANKPYKASELIKSIIVASANDASVAMAERLYGSESACVDEMNARAKEWGLDDSLM